MGERRIRKLVAWVACWLLAFSLAFISFPAGFVALVSWLSPLFGTSLRIVLSTTFILLGDPFVFTNLLILWIVVGFLGGLIIRRRIGSVLLMVSVYASQYLVLVVAGFRIFKIASNMGLTDFLSSPGDLLNLIPPVPVGSDIVTILGAPVISDFADILKNINPSTFNPSVIVNMLLSSMLVNVAKNLVVIMIASLVGCEVGKLLLKPFKTRMERLRSGFAKPSYVATEMPLGSPKVLKNIFLVLLILFGTILSTPIVLVDGSGSSYYAEYLFTPVYPNGDTYVRAAVLDNQYILRDVDFNGDAFQDCISASLMTHRALTSSINPDLTLFIEGLPGWVPGEVVSQNLEAYFSSFDTLFVATYDDVSLSIADSRAAQLASLFSSKTGVSLAYLASFEQPTGEGHYESIAIYSSVISFNSAGDSIIGLLPAAERDGLCDWLNTVWDSGILTPGQLSNSAEATAIVLGYAESGRVRSIPGGGLGLIKDFLPSADIPFAYITLSSYQLNITELLGIDNSITFSPQSNVSAVISVVPEGTQTIIQVITTAPEELSDRISETLTDMFGPTSSIEITRVSPGSTIDLDDITIEFTYRFPLKLKVEKSVTMDEVDRDQQVTVTLRVINEDSDPAENIRLDDSASLKYYPSAKVVSGFLNQSWDSISNATASGPLVLEHTYVICLDKEGTYTLTAASVNYTYRNTDFTESSNRVYVKVRPPSLFHVFAEGIPLAWSTLVSIIELIPSLRGNGSIVLTAVVLVIVAIIVLIETKLKV